MNSAKRVVVNTFAQYLRTIINVCLSLYSTRIVLDVLGQSDYGVYMLVGGVVAMVGFMMNALVVTTQRHLSYSYGKGDSEETRILFSNSLSVHLLLGVILVSILVAISPFLFDYLNVEPSRLDVTRNVYYITLVILFCSLLTAPFRGLFIARENIVYISIVDILDGVLKLALVLYLSTINADKLYTYAWMMAGVSAFNVIAFAVYSLYLYPESCLIPRIRDLSKKHLKALLQFAGWTSYSTGCIVLRTQGIAVILNNFLRNTIINSAYGIAIQVSGSVNFVAQAILNAMSPRVVKAEGEGNREKMLGLSALTSKFCFLLLSMIAIPLVFEMPSILEVWLGRDNVPDYAVSFCQFILIASIIDQLTVGLGIANQAIGRIRNYSLLINTVKIMTLPLVWFFLHQGWPIVSVMWIYLTIECLCVVLRLIYMKYSIGLSILFFSKQVILRTLIPTMSLIALGAVMVWGVDVPFRFMLTMILSVVIDSIVIYKFSLCKEERLIVCRFFHGFGKILSLKRLTHKPLSVE